jgi:hypothetical protein
VATDEMNDPESDLFSRVMGSSISIHNSRLSPPHRRNGGMNGIPHLFLDGTPWTAEGLYRYIWKCCNSGSDSVTV